MTADELQAIRDRCEKATAGPWEADEDGGIECANGGGICQITHHGNVNTIARTGERFSSGNTAFIAHARSDIPALLEEIDRLRAKMRLP